MKDRFTFWYVNRELFFVVVRKFKCEQGVYMDAE